MSETRARSALVRNLPKKGWTIEGNVGTFKELTLDLGDADWKMNKNEGGKIAEVASGLYGKSQMADIKKAAHDAGLPFAPVGKGGGEGGTPREMSDETKTKMREKRQAAAAAKKVDKDGESADQVEKPEGESSTKEEGSADTPSEED